MHQLAAEAVQPTVIVSFGPLGAGQARERERSRRRRRGRRLLFCGAFVCFVLGQLALQHALERLPDDRSSTQDSRQAMVANARQDSLPVEADARQGDPSAPTPTLNGADLDLLYPPHHGWVNGSWSYSGVPAPWLDEMRNDWLRSLGKHQTDMLPPVPPLLHQTWKNPFPPRELFSPRWRASLKKCNPGWAYRLWTDAENLELVRSKYPELSRAYEGYASPIQRADVARYLIAHQSGGVYFDLDYECFHPLSPLLAGASLVLSYKAGSNFSKGASNSVFGSAAGHPFWRVVFDVLLNRSRTPLVGHTAVLFSTGPAVLREALRRMLRLTSAESISGVMLARLREALGIVVLDATHLHPLTAEKRDLAKVAGKLPSTAICMHHFVSSWVAHSSVEHADTEKRRQEGHVNAAVEGPGLSVRHENVW